MGLNEEWAKADPWARGQIPLSVTEYRLKEQFEEIRLI